MMQTQLQPIIPIDLITCRIALNGARIAIILIGTCIRSHFIVYRTPHMGIPYLLVLIPEM